MPTSALPDKYDRYIRLRRFVPTATVAVGREAFRMQIVASHGDEIPNEIFLHKRSLIDPYRSTYIDEFCAVASAFDFTIYPATAPNPTQSPPYFRKSVIDVYLPSLAVADQFWQDIQAEVANLINSLNKLDTLKQDADVWLPYAPPKSESSENSNYSL